MWFCISNRDTVMLSILSKQTEFQYFNHSSEMSDLKESNDSLPVDEERIKDAIRKLIEEFG